MRVSEIMTREVVSVPSGCPLDEAIRLFESCRFHHLPVADKGRLIGMISDRDIALATGWILASYRSTEDNSGPETVGQIMRTEIFTLPVNASVNDAAALMLDNRISAVPLLEDDKLVGIVTSTDLLRACRADSPGFDWKIDPKAKVESAMSKQLHTVDPDQTMADAIDICQNGSVRHLLVVEASRLVGILSDRDLRFGLGQEIVSDLVAQDEGRMEIPRTPLSALMATEVVTIQAGEALVTAADSMLENGFSSLPVMKGHQLVGIITQTDVLRSCC